MAATTLRDTTRALILDIEGTTTSIAFVYDTLFPFARAHMADFLERQWDDEAVQADVALVRDSRAASVQRRLGSSAAASLLGLGQRRQFRPHRRVPGVGA